MQHLKCQLVRWEDLYDLKDLWERTISLASEHFGKQQWGVQWKRRGKKPPAKRNYHGQYDSELLFLVQEKKWVRQSLDFKLHLKMNEQSAMTLGYAHFLPLHIDSHSAVAHLKPHNSSLPKAGLTQEIPDFSSHCCFTRSSSVDTQRLASWISVQALRGEMGSQRQGK